MFANGTYRQDIISGNLGEWIVKGAHAFAVTTSSIHSDSLLEYQKANRELGDFTDEHPFSSYSRRATPSFEMFTRVLDDLPMVSIDVITTLATS
jgi:hypothetical protein